MPKKMIIKKKYIFQKEPTKKAEEQIDRLIKDALSLQKSLKVKVQIHLSLKDLEKRF